MGAGDTGVVPYDPTIYLGAAEVRALLADRSPEGVFWDWPGDTEVVMARTAGS